MAIARKPQIEQKKDRRIWKTPVSPISWLALGSALLVLLIVVLIGQMSGVMPDPTVDPYREFGIVAFIMVLLVATYSLRRRFVRHLPGRVQDWLWVHIWLGIASVLIASIHENRQTVT